MSQSTLPLKKTKIVCTIGPASNNQETLEQMIAAGMNIVRINFAHGDFDSHRHTIATVRTAAAAKTGSMPRALSSMVKERTGMGYCTNMAREYLSSTFPNSCKGMKLGGHMRLWP